ncbi:hypothetical protein HRbin32_01702 [bacterium HR32]|nr:hypothetical protein HRbin32_01702 [bacterium HR32]
MLLHDVVRVCLDALQAVLPPGLHQVQVRRVPVHLFLRGPQLGQRRGPSVQRTRQDVCGAHQHLLGQQPGTQHLHRLLPRVEEHGDPVVAGHVARQLQGQVGLAPARGARQAVVEAWPEARQHLVEPVEGRDGVPQEPSGRGVLDVLDQVAHHVAHRHQPVAQPALLDLEQLPHHLAHEPHQIPRPRLVPPPEELLDPPLHRLQAPAALPALQGLQVAGHLRCRRRPREPHRAQQPVHLGAQQAALLHLVPHAELVQGRRAHHGQLQRHPGEPLGHRAVEHLGSEAFVERQRHQVPVRQQAAQHRNVQLVARVHGGQEFPPRPRGSSRGLIGASSVPALRFPCGAAVGCATVPTTGR